MVCTWATLLIALTGRRLAVTALAALLVSAAINPIFGTPYIALLGRVMVVAALLLLTYSYAEQWHIKWLPRWQVQLLAVPASPPLRRVQAHPAGRHVVVEM